MRLRPSAARVFGAAFAALVMPAAAASAATTVSANPSHDGATSPISGVVRAAGRPIGGATLVVRAFIEGVDTVVATLRSDADGSFVLPAARPGLYTVLTFSPGFRPAIARVLHRAGSDLVSFLPLDLERAGGILPTTPLGAADPWVARTLVKGDVLRDTDGIIAALDTAPPDDGPRLPQAPAAANASTKALVLPVRASVASMAGFASNGPATARTSLDVSGGVGDAVRFGVEGQYSRSVGVDDARAGDSSRLAFDLNPGGEQTFRVSTRRKVLPRDEGTEDPSRFAAHSLDWTGATGSRSQASVSARLLSQSNLIATGPAADLFAHATRAFEVQAKYRSGVLESGSVGFTVAYRTASSLEVGADDRETRVGGNASLRLLPFLVVEGGATGDFSNRAHGVTPEVTIAVESGGWRAYGSASRRWERGQRELFQLGVVGVDDEDLTRRARALVRGGLVYKEADGTSLTFEMARREMGSTYRYLLVPDFVDRLDSLYYFDGDVATELSSGATFRVGEGLEGRLSARGGRIRGERVAAIQRDDAGYALVDAALRIAPTDTVLGVGYRTVSQTLTRGDLDLKNELSAVDLSIAQVLPLAVRGSEWKALFSVEFGRRREGLDPERANRQLAGGLSVGFN